VREVEADPAGGSDGDPVAASIARWGGDYVVTDGLDGPASTWPIDRAMRRVRKIVPGLPETFVFHDLRHFFASSLIEAGFRRQARAGSTPARQRQDDAGHLRAPVPEPGRRGAVKLGTLYASQPEADGLVSLQRGTG
jgi:hypothetical protein